MTITVAFASQAELDRMAPAPAGARYIVWDIEHEQPTPVDLVIARYMIPAAALAALDPATVRVVQGQSLGYDGVAAALPAGITYCNAVAVHEASTGELALALILASLRGIPAAVDAQREARWAHARQPGLAGRTVLLLGVGGVGAEIEARLSGFDVSLVRVARTARDGVHGFDELPALLPSADVVILAVPLTAETTRLVDAPFLAAMKIGALLVNVSRGAVVDTDALLASLETGRVTAALDVTDPEPLPPAHPLWRAAGVLITAHIGGHTAAMAGRIDTVIREQVRRIVAGEQPANVVIPASREN